MKKAFPIFVIIAAAAASAALVWLFLGAEEPLEPATENVQEPARTEIAEVVPEAKGSSEAEAVPGNTEGTATSGKKKRVVVDLPENDGQDTDFLPDVELTENDRQTLVSMQEALDEENFSKVMQFARIAMQSPEPAVRMKAVDALSWFGPRALPELTALMADADEDVAGSALSSVESALMDIESTREKLDIAASYMRAFKSSEDALTMLGGALAVAGSDLIIEADENESAACNIIVDTLMSLIASGGTCATEAQERYQEISGYEWMGEAEARRWAENPSDYEPPAEPEDAE